MYKRDENWVRSGIPTCPSQPCDTLAVKTWSILYLCLLQYSQSRVNPPGPSLPPQKNCIMGFCFLPLPPLSRAVCLKWYLFLFVTAHRDCCLDILPSWHPDRYDTDAFGQKSEPVCYMPVRRRDARSASESPQCPAGEMERARGPQMNSRKRVGIIRRDPATRFQFEVFTLTWVFPSFFFLFSPCFPACERVGFLFLPRLQGPRGAGLSWAGKERTSVWSAFISVEKDLTVPGFGDHYLSFSFIKSVMRKFKIKGFVNWIPVWKGGTYQEVRAEACR